MIGIRGATSVVSDDEISVRERVAELVREILARNKIQKLIAIIFSVTPDITSINPATAVRNDLHLTKVPMMCFQEAMFNDSPGHMIRVLVLCESQTKNFVYLHDAVDLRPDLEVEA